ncbi:MULTISPECIES: ABC transporter ATP-binding protein [Halomonas]|uniref:Ferric enterobactin transporter FepC n=1 Tax=Halomonas halophila TaxID=29573 RepID=A0ABQ0U6I3_9GAMM|nr:MULTISPECIES: ABC transporter ATP-binding protein [Halomonas]MDR5890328.1 ABC transporter ATP-binding protein [Halomonas salina]RAH38506.1 ABC transporter ATP-binding protein [Halomonas sp. SL1]WJY08180.1 ABC transporter ATP-binding protein [Halomonas halophila]GEK73776.1 ferric enterobactin transporter FepC [Halomonas halophila]
MNAPQRLQAEALSLSHGRRTVIADLAVALPPGKVTAIVGPNGCGKSTLLAGLARLHAPDAGAVLLDGQDIQRLPARELARRLALLPQEATAPEGLTVGDLIRFGRQPHQGWLRQWSGDDQRAVEAAVAAAGLEALADRPLEALSGGQRQRAWIAMTIAQQTPLLLLDEPTSALDLGHQLEVFELVRRLAADGRTLALVLHDLASACRYADHLVAMRDGRIVAQGTPAEVVTEALVRELYGVTCTLVPDPATGTPILTDLRRA